MLRTFLEDIITRAGQITLEQKGRLSEIQVVRKSEKDLVTETDRAVEEYLIEQIRRRYPSHGIFGEETGTHAGSEYRWIIDPIDGTTSFLHDQPFYSVSVAVEQNGRLILAAVHAPALGELFMAEKGKGATLNGRPIRVSGRDKLVDSVLGTGFACVRQNLPHNNLPYFNEMVPLVRGIRRYGSAAADLCYVAAGKMDGFWELNLKIYDIAAGILIVQEAGGVVTDFAGKPDDMPFEIAASNGKIHHELTALLTKVKTQRG